MTNHKHSIPVFFFLKKMADVVLSPLCLTSQVIVNVILPSLLKFKRSSKVNLPYSQCRGFSFYFSISTLFGCDFFQ